MSGASLETVSTVFVGGISPGVSDRWLVQLFQACGGYRSFKRVSKAFGFADFTTLRDALRVLHVLHDLELPSMGAERTQPRKKLIVKADEKTSAFLSEFEKTMVRTDADALQDAAARSRVDFVLQAMASPNADTGEEPERFEIPSHLKDLPVHEIPAERRKDVMSEIEKFRLGAVASDAARRRKELELERQRNAMLAAQEARASPVPTAAASAEITIDDPEADDEKREAQRREQEQAKKEREGRQAEDAYLARERERLAAWAAHTPSRDPVQTRAHWDAMSEDDELALELFWTDRYVGTCSHNRRRWLQQRASVRDREVAQDDSDRAAQKEKEVEGQRQADAFFASLDTDTAAPAWRPSQGAPLKLQVHHVEQRPGDRARAELLEQVRGLSPEARMAHIASLSRDTLWAITPDWANVDWPSIASLLDTGIAESFGESVPDLCDAAMEKLRDHADAHDIEEALAPVLDDDAPALVDQVWRALLSTA
ncbi:spliceosomal complex protein [Malassezia pachydermatis]